MNRLGRVKKLEQKAAAKRSANRAAGLHHFRPALLHRSDLLHLAVEIALADDAGDAARARELREVWNREAAAVFAKLDPAGSGWPAEQWRWSPGVSEPTRVVCNPDFYGNDAHETAQRIMSQTRSCQELSETTANGKRAGDDGDGRIAENQ
jgi:hypothetical protein